MTSCESKANEISDRTLARELEATHSFQPNGSPRVRLARTNSNLRSESIAEAIGESCTSVDVDAGAVDTLAEGLGMSVVLGDNAVGMVGRVVVDMLHGVGEGRDGLDGEGELEELGIVVLGRDGDELRLAGGEGRGDGRGGGESGECCGAALEGDGGGEEGGGELGPDGGEKRVVDEEGLGGVAGGGVGGLRAKRMVTNPLSEDRAPTALTFESRTTLIAFCPTALSST